MLDGDTTHEATIGTTCDGMTIPAKGRGGSRETQKTQVKETWKDSYEEGELVEMYKGRKITHRYLKKENLEAAIPKLFHFSSKGTNSNALQVTIRLGLDSGLKVPYASMRSTIGQGLTIRFGSVKSKSELLKGISQVFVPFLNGDSGSLTIPEQIKKIRRFIDSEDKKEEKGELKGEKSSEHFVYSAGEDFYRYAEQVKNLQYPYHIEDTGLDARLRQILVPVEGNYLSLAPLFSTPLSMMATNVAYGLSQSSFQAREKLEKEAEKLTEEERTSARRKARKRLTFIDYPLGGTNASNVDVALGNGHRLVCAGFYRPDRQASRRFSVLHRGLKDKLYLDLDSLRRYADFVAANKWERHTEAQHVHRLKKLFRGLLTTAEAWAVSLKEEDWEGLSEFDQGWLDPLARGSGWIRSAHNDFVWKVVETNIGTTEEVRYVQSNLPLLRRSAIPAGIR